MDYQHGTVKNPCKDGPAELTIGQRVRSLDEDYPDMEGYIINITTGEDAAQESESNDPAVHVCFDFSEVPPEDPGVYAALEKHFRDLYADDTKQLEDVALDDVIFSFADLEPLDGTAA